MFIHLMFISLSLSLLSICWPVLPAAYNLLKRGGRVLLTEILLPRIARQGTLRLVSIRGQAQKARIENGFPTVSSPLPSIANLCYLLRYTLLRHELWVEDSGLLALLSLLSSLIVSLSLLLLLSVSLLLSSLLLLLLLIQPY